VVEEGDRGEGESGGVLGEREVEKRKRGVVGAGKRKKGVNIRDRRRGRVTDTISSLWKSKIWGKEKARCPIEEKKNPTVDKRWTMAIWEEKRGVAEKRREGTAGGKKRKSAHPTGHREYGKLRPSVKKRKKTRRARLWRGKAPKMSCCSQPKDLGERGGKDPQ